MLPEAPKDSSQQGSAVQGVFLNCSSAALGILMGEAAESGCSLSVPRVDLLLPLPSVCLVAGLLWR